MESLESLQARKKELEKELSYLVVKKSGNQKWASGIQDQYDTKSYTYEEYLNPQKAYALKDEISKLDYEIKTYAQRARNQREAQEEIKQMHSQKYNYMSNGQMERTDNPAMAARYTTRDRFYNESKVKQAIAKLTGQKKKFEALWRKAGNVETIEEQQKIADELNKMFR